MIIPLYVVYGYARCIFEGQNKVYTDAHVRDPRPHVELSTSYERRHVGKPRLANTFGGKEKPKKKEIHPVNPNVEAYRRDGNVVGNKHV
eukprot:2734460-Pyramimonas_sp.AAC.1